MVWPFNDVSVPLFRSEDMSYVSVTVTNDAAYETLMEIGKFGRFHFVDVRHTQHIPSQHINTHCTDGLIINFINALYISLYVTVECCCEGGCPLPGSFDLQE